MASGRSRVRPPGEGRLIQLVYYAYVAGSAVARAVPERIAYWMAHALGGLWARVATKKRLVVARNLARVTGEPLESPALDRIVREAFRSYARYWLETFRLVRENKEFFLERFQGVNDEAIDKALARGKGVVVVVGHLGNWDAAGAWVGARGNSLVTVVELLRPRRMFEFFADHRAALGMTIYPAEKGVTDKLVAELEAGAVVAILGDRDLKGTGPEIEFFGEPTTLPAGAASVALRAGVPMLVAGVYEIHIPGVGRGWQAVISDPIDLPSEPGPEATVELTRTAARHLEDFVRRHPEQWHVFQPFWPADKNGSE